jgi:hypothetical protein
MDEINILFQKHVQSNLVEVKERWNNLEWLSKIS